MAFINDHIVPFHLAEKWAIFNDILIGGQKDLPIRKFDVVLLVFSNSRRAFVNNLSNPWSPFFEFKIPIGQSASLSLSIPRNGATQTERNLPKWNDDQERTILLLPFNQVGNQRNCLDGFSQTHLVC